MEKNIMATLQKFVQSPEFVDAVVSSTQAGFGGGGYSVEIFPDDTHRVLWNGQIGNRYESPGEIIRIPQLSESEVAEADEENGLSLRDVAAFYQDELAAQLLDNQDA